MAASPTIEEIVAEEIQHLEKRKADLIRLITLQEEVAGLQSRVIACNEKVASVARIVSEVVAQYYKIPFGIIMSRRRPQFLVEPRQVICALTEKFTAAGPAELGRCFERNHATILNSFERIRHRIETEPKFCNTLTQLSAACKKRIDREVKP